MYPKYCIVLLPKKMNKLQKTKCCGSFEPTKLKENKKGIWCGVQLITSVRGVKLTYN